MKTKKSHPFCESGHQSNDLHRAYITPKFLMCGECRRPIRKLTYEDHERLRSVTEISEMESNELGCILDQIRTS